MGEQDVGAGMICGLENFSEVVIMSAIGWAKHFKDFQGSWAVL